MNDTIVAPVMKLNAQTPVNYVYDKEAYLARYGQYLAALGTCYWRLDDAIAAHDKLANGYIIFGAEYENKKGCVARKYFIFTPRDFIERVVPLARQYKVWPHFHEHLIGPYRRFILDIDSGDTKPDIENIQKVAADVIAAQNYSNHKKDKFNSNTLLQSCFHGDDRTRATVYDASGFNMIAQKYKYSYHIVYEELVLSPKDCAHLAALIRSQLPAHEAAFIDQQIYRNKGSIRTVYSVKLHDTRRKLPADQEYINMMSQVPDIIPMLRPTLWVSSMFLNTYDRAAIVDTKTHPMIDHVPYEADNETLAEISKAVSLVSPHLSFDARSFMPGQSSNLLKLTREETGHCAVCNREHDNSDAYVYIKQGTYWLGCFRQKQYNGTPICLNIVAQKKLCPYEVPTFTWAKNVRQVNQKYLDNFNMPFDTLVVRSPLGTGKTVSLLELIGRQTMDSRIIVVSFRIAYTTEIHSKLKQYGFVRYDETETMADKKRIIVQAESLYRLLDHGRLESADLLVLDEIESICAQFDSPTMGDHRNLCISTMKQLLKKSKQVVALDGNFGPRGDAILGQFRAPYDLIVNTYDNEIGREYQIMGKEHFVKTFLAMCETKRIALASTSKRFINGLYALMPENIRAETLVVSAETSAKDKNVIFADINNELRKYRHVFYTPTLLAGNSFDGQHFDCLFAYMPPRVEAAQCIQMMKRVRTFAANTHYVCIQVDKDCYRGDALTLDALEEQIILGHKTLCVDFQFTDDGQLGIDRNNLGTMLTMLNQIEHNKTIHDYDYEYLGRLLSMGAKIKFMKDKAPKDITNIKDQEKLYTITHNARILEHSYHTMETVNEDTGDIELTHVPITNTMLQETIGRMPNYLQQLNYIERSACELIMDLKLEEPLTEEIIVNYSTPEGKYAWHSRQQLKEFGGNVDQWHFSKYCYFARPEEIINGAEIIYDYSSFILCNSNNIDIGIVEEKLLRHCVSFLLSKCDVSNINDPNIMKRNKRDEIIDKYIKPYFIKNEKILGRYLRDTHQIKEWPRKKIFAGFNNLLSTCLRYEFLADKHSRFYTLTEIFQ